MFVFLEFGKKAFLQGKVYWKNKLENLLVLFDYKVNMCHQFDHFVTSMIYSLSSPLSPE